MLYGVYHDWVHQNTGNHLDGGIKEDDKFQANWEKLVCLPIQHYNTPYSRVVRRFIAIFGVEINVIQARNWKADQVIAFQLVILQCVQIFTDAKNIHAQIKFRIDFWNCGAFE